MQITSVSQSVRGLDTIGPTQLSILSNGRRQSDKSGCTRYSTHPSYPSYPVQRARERGTTVMETKQAYAAWSCWGVYTGLPIHRVCMESGGGNEPRGVQEHAVLIGSQLPPSSMWIVLHIYGAALHKDWIIAHFFFSSPGLEDSEQSGGAEHSYRRGLRRYRSWSIYGRYIPASQLR